MALVSCPEQRLPIQHLPGLEYPQTSAGHLISSFSPPFPSAIYKSITRTPLPELQLTLDCPLGEAAEWKLGLSKLPDGIAEQQPVVKKSQIAVRPG